MVSKNKIVFSLIRRRAFKIVKIFVEILLFIIIFSNEITSNNNSYCFFALCLWLIISYIIARYDNTRQIKEIIKQSISTLCLYLSCILFLFNGIYFYNISNFKLLTVFFIFSLATQVVFNILFLLITINKKEFLLVNSKSQEESTFDLINESSKHITFRIVTFDEVLHFNPQYYEAIIIDEFVNLTIKQRDIIKKLEQENISILNSISFHELYNERLLSDLIPNGVILNSTRSKIINYQFILKKVADYLISIVLLFITTPLMIVSILMIYFEDRGPVFYSQIRTGIFRKKYRIYKLRTMKIDAEKYGAQWSTNGDERITTVGKILRKTRIDELPQLFSVLSGDMSLIGPRPERPELEENIIENIKNYNERYSVKPGLSGWAQVNYPYGASLEDTRRKLSYDLYYIKNFSIFLDILIFFKTIQLVFTAKGSIPLKY